MFVFRWAAFRLALVSVVLVTVVVVSSLLLVKDPGRTFQKLSRGIERSLRAEAASVFVSTSSDQLCLAISEHLRKYGW